MDLCTKVYEVTEEFPRSEVYGLTTQVRRAAVSVSNIAEGSARSSVKETAQFYSIARGSLSELDTQIEIAFRLGYLTQAAAAGFDEMMVDLDRVLYGLWKKLNADI